ncbi:hypothetical protein H0H93_000336, partial [Arthromyces matolae]
GNADLPEKKDQLLEYFKQKGNGNGSKWVHLDIQELFELKAPLLMALAISPLLLLASKNLQKNPPSKEHLFNSWLLLGQYTRPQRIQYAEREIWKAVWDTARGNDSHTCLTAALERICGVDFPNDIEWDPIHILKGSLNSPPPSSPVSASANQSTSNSSSGITTVEDRNNARWNTIISQIPAASELSREIIAADAADRLQRERDREVVNAMYAAQARPKDGVDEIVSAIQAGNPNGARDRADEVGGNANSNNEGGHQHHHEEEEEASIFTGGQGNGNDGADIEQDEDHDQDLDGDQDMDQEEERKRREEEEKRKKEEEKKKEKKMEEEEEEKKKEEGKKKKKKMDEARERRRKKEEEKKRAQTADSSRKKMVIEVIDISSDDDANDDDEVASSKGIKYDRVKLDGGPPLLTGEAPLLSDLFSSRFASAHFKNDLQWIYGLDQANFDNQSDPKFESSIETIKYVDYVKMDSKQLGSIFAKRNILVTDVPPSPTRPESYERALQTLGRMDREMDIHDLSVALSDKGSTPYPRYRNATFSDLVGSLNVEHPKSLNALAIPSSLTNPLPNHPIFTDEKAWDQRGGSWDPKAGTADMYPSNKMRWALAATGWASHPWHIDSDGQATCIYVDFGEKWWFVGTPTGSDRIQLEGGIRRFLSIDADAVNSKKLQVEAVLLDPTKYFFMRPGTLHAVVTPVPTTVRGRYFYSTSTLRQTCFGIYHDFVMGKFITNDGHPRTAHSLLSCILDFYAHTLMNDVQDQLDQVPDPTNFEKFIDLMIFLHLVELRSAVHDWGYVPPQNSTPEDIRNRLMAIKDRKTGRKLKQWLFARFDLVLEGKPLAVKEARSRFDHQFLAYQATALSRHKKAAKQARTEGTFVATPKQLDDAIRLCLFGSRALSFFLRVYIKAPTPSFHWAGPTYLVRRRTEEEFRKHYACRSDEFDPEMPWFENGLTAGDATFMQYFKSDDEGNDEEMDIEMEANQGDDISERDQDWMQNAKKRKAGGSSLAQAKRPKKG